MSKWFKEVPTERGLYWVKDEGGGPTLYRFLPSSGGMECAPIDTRRYYSQTLFSSECLLSDSEFMKLEVPK
jgi:hypothetical protein